MTAEEARECVLAAANAHLEDLRSGVEDGIYEAADNAEEIALLTEAIAWMEMVSDA